MTRTHRLRSRLTVERIEDRLAPAGIPALHSNPGATAAIYLDFDGHFEPTWLGYTNITTPAYDRDGNPAAVSDDESEYMRAVWARAAEDFAPFNLDVTTVEPAELAPGRPIADANKKALRVSIGGDGMWYQNGGYGGVGAYNSFTNTTANVCFVFAKPTSAVKWVGDTVSHEAGHSFGLYHQSKFDANGVEEAEYSYGDYLTWSPLMGGSGGPLSIWFNGPTTSATTLQDDLAMLASTTNGFGYRADDHGNTAATATPLTATGPTTWTRSGVVGTNTDVDYFSFTLATPDTLRIATAGPGADANLDAVVELRTSAGALLETADPTGSFDASLVRVLAPGTYVAAVRSNGMYGRIGSYTLTVDAPPAGVLVTPATTNLTTAEDGRATSFNVVLRTAPAADVVIPVATSNPAEGVVSVSSLTFTPANWNVPQTVTISGVADGVADGDAGYTVTVGAAVTTDAEYAGLGRTDLPVVNADVADAGFLYRTDSTTDRIVRTRLDGSFEQTVVDLKAVFGGLDYTPVGLAVDAAGGRVYWADATTDALYRANLDGSGAERLFALPAGSPFNVAVDVAGGKVYWTNTATTTRKLWRANLDGTGVQEFWAGTGLPYGLALDAAAGKLYWTENTTGVGSGATLRRANLDGSGVEVLWSAAGSSSQAVALDPAGGKVYWTDAARDLIYRANLDGTAAEVVVDVSAASPAAYLRALHVDAAAGHLYWQLTGTNALYRATLDGSNVARLGAANLATGLVVVRQPGGVSVAGHANLTTTEGGAGTSFQVVLTTRPTATVTIPVSSADTTEGTVSVSSLTFTPANWNVPQTVTVTPVEDTATDGSVTYAVVLGAAVSGDPAYHGFDPADASVTNADNDFNKFFVADDASTDRTYRYGAPINARSNSTLNSGNTAPRGVATTAAGDKLWVVDANKKVYVYNSSTGALLGSWNANSLPSNATVEGITVWGADVWLVDARGDKVYRYANAASRTSGSQSAMSSFALHADNVGPKDLVTDGVSIWVVDDQTLDRVYKYTLSGTYVGRWNIDPANGSPTGITLDPSNPRHLWVVDNGTDRVYQYDYATTRTSGSQLASTSTALAAGNTNPQGIADPPPGGGEVATGGDPGEAGSGPGARPYTASASASVPSVDASVAPAPWHRLRSLHVPPTGGTTVGEPASPLAGPRLRPVGVHGPTVAAGNDPVDTPVTWGIMVGSDESPPLEFMEDILALR